MERNMNAKKCKIYISGPNRNDMVCKDITKNILTASGDEEITAAKRT